MEKLGEILGILGLFAAMMAILALGSEILIDNLKVVIGFKRKPSALDSLDTFSGKLAGSLKDLGSTQEAEKQLQELSKGLQSAIQPVQQVGTLVQNIRNADIKTALETAAKLVSSSPNAVKTVQEITSELSRGVEETLAEIQIHPTVRKRITKAIAQTTDAMLADGTVDEVVHSLQEAGIEVATIWVRNEIPKLAEESQDVLLDAVETKLVPVLQNFALDATEIEEIKEGLSIEIEKLSPEMVSGFLHLDSVRELMQSVENRRQEIQSPARKAWRWLRSTPILGTGLSFNKTFPFIHRAKKCEWTPKGFPDGFGLLTWPEVLWNWVFQRGPEGERKVGEADPVAPFSAKTLASRLMEMDNLHLDQEASRKRLLRVFSVFVGVYLAFLVQVNAVDLLIPAFPGIKAINDTINTATVIGWINYLPFINIPLAKGLLVSGLKLNAGILLSGLAASAGSSFWHNLLGRLQSARAGVTQVERIIETKGGDN